MKQTLSSSLRTFFFKQYPSWVSSGEVERMIFKNRNGTTAKPSSVTRAVRLLESSSVVAVKYEGAAQTATYKYLPKEFRSNYIPYSLRPQFKKNVLWRVSPQEIANRKLPMDEGSREFWDSIPDKVV